MVAFWSRLVNLWFGRDLRFRRGGVALVVGLMAPVLIGFVGFAVDAPFWFVQKTSLQTATDMAAMKAASDLETNPATPASTLQADALAAAIAAQQTPYQLVASELTVTQLADKRQVKVTATIPGNKYFSEQYSPSSVNISATSIAGVGYPLISTQATCYSVDSYTYLFSTGFGTIDTAHSSGIDPYQCANPPTAPAVYNAYCGGGVLSCSLDVLNAGNFLVPFAIQISPTGGTGGLNAVLQPVVTTLTTLLSGASYAGGGSMTYIGPGSPQCSGSDCTVTAGVYNGGLTIAPKMNVTFAASGGSNYFLIENGNLVMSNQDTISGANNAVFYFSGASPGGFVEATQVKLNTAPIDSGSITLTSTSTFTSQSLIGTQTSSPLSSMAYAQQQAVTQGLLSTLGLPGQNLAGTNFESVVSVCTQSTSTCAAPQGQSATFESTLLPSLGLLSTLAPNISLVNLLSNEGETSTTVINSSVMIKNGVPTDWAQSESASSTLTNVLQTVPNVLKSLGLSDPLGVLTPLIQKVLNNIVPNETNSQSYAASGVFTGQASTGTPPSSATGCAAGSTIYSATITPNFSPGFSDILQVAGQNGASGALTTSDTINVCGTSEVANFNPIDTGTAMNNSYAAGASTVMLLQ
jgi:Flp pilus assembly protein TadG